MKTTLTLSLPKYFDFRRTIFSHGWYALPPFRVTDVVGQPLALCTAFALDTKKSAAVTLSQQDHQLKIEVEHASRLTQAHNLRIVAVVAEIVRLNESFDEFYSAANEHEGFRWVKKIGAGRMLRSPSVFEDVVKMMFTTNCSWSLTESMVGNLTSKLGKKFKEEIFLFPTAEAIAECSEKYLRREIRCGYRAPYVLELSKNITQGKTSLEHLRSSEQTTEELYWELRSIKGIGHYAAGNLLKLLGRYDYLGIDSWVRMKFSELHKRGRKTSDAVIEKHYDHFGKWRGLFCWMDVTKEWHDKFLNELKK